MNNYDDYLKREADYQDLKITSLQNLDLNVEMKL